MVTYFVVQPFVRTKKGAIVPGDARQVSSSGHARRACEKMSEELVGVVAFSRTGDPGSGDWDDAVIIATAGVIPDDVLDLQVAS